MSTTTVNTTTTVGTATPRPSRLVALLAALGLVAAISLAACGGSDKKTPTTTVTSPLTTTQAIDTNFTGAGSAEFCDMAKTLNTNPSAIAPNASTAQIRANLETADKDIHHAADVAPAEIKPDVTVIAASFSSIVAAIGQAGYDLTKVSPEALATFQSPEFSSAAARFQAYLTQICHITK